MPSTHLLHSTAAAALQEREAALRALLDADHTAALDAHDAAHEVTDFKDVADEASQAALDDVAATHAAVELAQVLAAQRRLAEGRYGSCTVCGAAIDPKRLLALPHTPFCTACQAERERSAQRSR
jgi:DnaK suppressor protein